MCEALVSNLDELLNRFEDQNPSLVSLSDDAANLLIDELIKQICWDNAFCKDIFDHILLHNLDIKFSREYEIEEYFPTDNEDYKQEDDEDNSGDDDDSMLEWQKTRVQYFMINVLKNEYLGFLRSLGDPSQKTTVVTREFRHGMAYYFKDSLFKDSLFKDSLPTSRAGVKFFYQIVRMLLKLDDIHERIEDLESVSKCNAFLGWILFRYLDRDKDCLSIGFPYAVCGVEIFLTEMKIIVNHRGGEMEQ